MLSYDDKPVIPTPNELRIVEKKRRREFLLEAAKKATKRKIDGILEGREGYGETDEGELIVDLYCYDPNDNDEEPENAREIRRILEDGAFPEDEFSSWLEVYSWEFVKFSDDGVVWYAIIEKKL